MYEKTITAIEKKVMRTIWTTDHPMALSEMVERVNEKYHGSWKPQTISTYLAKLVKKNYLSMIRKGRIFLYFPEVAQEDFVKHEVKDLCDYYSENSLVDFLTALHDTGNICKSDLDEMNQILLED